MLNNKGFAVSAAIYSLLIIFLFLVTLIIIVFNSSNTIISSSHDDIVENEFRIYSIEDFITIKSMVNNGKIKSGVNIYLEKDLDFNQSDSYKKSSSISFGDINNDTTTDNILLELTTGSGVTTGFKKSGDQIVNFDGKGHKLINLRFNTALPEYLFDINSVKNLIFEDIIISQGEEYICNPLSTCDL